MGTLKVASLFCGCGGLDLGLSGGFKYLGEEYEKHPVEIIYAVDFDPYPCSIYNKNFEHKCCTADIAKVKSEDIPPHHILIGGFPCQSFSIVAQNPPRLGYKDEKGQLFFEMARILKDRKPEIFIAENVKGILSANKGQAFPLILESFRNAGYFVTYGLLNASDFGVPQKRERVFIVGMRDKRIFDNFNFPKPTTPEDKIPLSKVVLPESDVNEKYFFSNKAVEGMMKVKEKMNKGRVQNLTSPCNTISAHLSKASLNSVDPVLCINNRYRRFTPLEAARIQSFPDDFLFTETDTRNYKAIGNAVPPVLMWHLSDAIFNAIKISN
jgi:DNA (cytosine-5)-methyltransferase 1